MPAAPPSSYLLEEADSRRPVTPDTFYTVCERRENDILDKRDTAKTEHFAVAWFPRVAFPDVYS